MPANILPKPLRKQGNNAADKQDISKAMQLYTQLEQATSGTGNANFRFVELPACIAMIADYVKHGGKGPIPDITERRNMIKEFFYGILERERERQGISASSEKMLNVFMDVALSYDEFTIEDIEIASAGIGTESNDGLGRSPRPRFSESGLQRES